MKKREKRSKRHGVSKCAILSFNTNDAVCFSFKLLLLLVEFYDPSKLFLLISSRYLSLGYHYVAFLYDIYTSDGA